jgi:predicted  nucleic acid-binding Zn-ribbon protein
MDNITRDQIEFLVELQQKESAAAKVQMELNELPEKLIQIESGLREIEEVINLKKENLAELKKVYRNYDAEIRVNQERIKKREEQLRSVTTNKDYQAILKEISEIKKASSRLEDETLDCLDKIDAAESEIRDQEESYEAEAVEVSEKKSVLEASADSERRSLDKFSAQRDELSSKIDPELIRQYEIIKSYSRGIAIVQVIDSICSGCNMNIPPQMYNELHRENELRTCPHCHRMVYVST